MVRTEMRSLEKAMGQCNYIDPLVQKRLIETLRDLLQQGIGKIVYAAEFTNEFNERLQAIQGELTR